MAYEKQTWNTGDVITEEKLNHMEDGIASASIPLYTPEVIGQHGGANYYQFFASNVVSILDGDDGNVMSIFLIKHEDPNDLFKIPFVHSIYGENTDTTLSEAIDMPISGTWFVNLESSNTMTIGPVENKNRNGFYLNEEITNAKLYHLDDMYILFMDHIPNVIESFANVVTPPMN